MTHNRRSEGVSAVPDARGQRGRGPSQDAVPIPPSLSGGQRPGQGKTHALYRFFDEAGDLLYVGITVDIGARWNAHSKDKPWWSDVRSCTVEPHPDRPAVLAAERAAIVAERPKHNVVHNRPRRRVSRRAVADAVELFFGSPIVAESMPDLCHDYCERDQPGSSVMCFPYRWESGVALYQCPRGHRWRCSWGHTASGLDPKYCTHAWVDPDQNGNLACCDCDRLIYQEGRTASW